MSFFRFIFRILLLFIPLASIACGVGFFLNDFSGPVITMTPDTGRISPVRDIHLNIRDAKSDLASVKILLKTGSREIVIAEQNFAEKRREQNIVFNMRNFDIRSGSAELEVKAKDTALFGLGNSTKKVWNVVLDAQAPRTRMLTGAPSVRRGSIGAVAFSASEDLARAGIRIGDLFFPAFLQPGGVYFCLFAFPHDLPAGNFRPELIAEDTAGNESKTRIAVHAVERRFRSDTLTISDAFLENKMPLFEEQIPDAATHLERYIRVNTEIRKANAEKLMETGRDTASSILWKGSFRRLPRSATRAMFGDDRTYLYNGVKIDRQTHMGIDLASVAHAPIPAGNDGRVVLAEDLGIFGLLVIIDHGLGLQSLYSHMSEITVKVGDILKKDDIIGYTGKTGLAGGDHLHFGILLSGIQLQPLDWFDEKWIRNAITDPLHNAAVK